MFIPAGNPNEKPQGWKPLDIIQSYSRKLTGFFNDKVSKILGERKEIDSATTPKKPDNFFGNLAKKGKGFASASVLGATVAIGAQVGQIPQEGSLINDGFIRAPDTKNTNSFKKGIPITEKTQEEVTSHLPIGSLKETSVKIRKAELGTLYETSQYDETGKFLQKIKKGTKILIDQSKPVKTLRNQKTGKNEVYVHIKGMIHVDKIGQVTLEPQSGYIAAPWLNSAAQSKGHSRKENQETANKEIPEPKKPISFAGYLGPDGREIPEYILTSVTAKYLGNVLAPKVQAKIEEVKVEIETNRELMKEEVLSRKVKLPETKGYQRQVASIKKIGELNTLNNAITSFTLNGVSALKNPTVVSLLNSIKGTPEWQRVILQASTVHKQKLRGNHK